jgi:uncharacterized protein DUF4387
MQLYQICRLIRSKNAGPFTLTIDIMFDDLAAYERVRDSGVLSATVVSQIYGLPAEHVRFFEYEAALALKISFPRQVTSGSIGDNDVYGGQFHSPLVLLEVLACRLTSLAEAGVLCASCAAVSGVSPGVSAASA